MAKFTKQKDGRYRTTIQLGYGPDGNPIKKYLSALTIKELEKKIFDAKNDLSNGLLIADTTLFGAYADKWVEIYKGTKSVQTRAMYVNAIRLLEPLRQTPLKEINRSMLQEVINDNSDHPRSCEVMLLTLKQIFKSAMADGLTGKNPCTGLELPRHVAKENRPLTEEEKKALRSAVLLPQERLLLLLLYGTGCRPAEAYALTKDDFDFRAGTIYINKAVQYDGNYPVSVSYPKTNTSIRHVIVSESVMRGLKHLIDKISHDNVLGGNMGQILNKCQYNTIFKHILLKSGLKDSGITQYTFRHNFCTECKWNGLSLKETQHQMGHKDYKMILKVYEHLDSLKENTREKMANMVM